MEAIILAGGFGTRLREVVPELPKSMAPIAGKPFLEILLSTLAKKGFQRVILSLGYKAEVITAYFGISFSGMELVHEVETTPLGTGGAVRKAFLKCQGDHVYIFNGDTYLDLEVPKLEDQWSKDKAPIIVAFQAPDTARYGRLLVNDGLVLGFAEKGVIGRGLINAGCYVLPPNILDAFACGQAFSLEKDFFAEAVTKTKFQCFVTEGKFIDIGVPEEYSRALSELSSLSNHNHG